MHEQPDLPTDFFVFVTSTDPIIEWNMSLGSISSAGLARATAGGVEARQYLEQKDRWFPWIPNPDFKSFVSFQMVRVLSGWRVEYNAERVRVAEFPHLPSRLACLYAWGSLDDAKRANQIARGRYRGTLKRCRLASPPLRVARCNSAVVAFARHAEEGNFFSEESANSTWRTYWSGSGEALEISRPNIMRPGGPPHRIPMPAEPLWEWLIDGKLHIEEDVDLPD